MAASQLSRVIDTLRGRSLPHEGAGLTDGQLLEHYLTSREETAFAALVHRHGPMVWCVCRRVLRSHHDAEDAFQATFLVLVRKASSIVPREMVANWLYGVAHQTALKARATTARRQIREKQVTALPEPPVAPQDPDDLPPLLDQELSQLPAKYRAVIVLCHLQGRTLKEVAQQLDLPAGTVASRLATARTMLAKRLVRCGQVVSGTALAALLSQNGASACVPSSVASTTIEAARLYAAGQAAAAGMLSGKAVVLAEGVLRTMLLTRLKIATAVLLTLAVLGTSAAALTRHMLANKPAQEPAREKEQPAAQEAKEKKEPPAPPVVKEKTNKDDQAHVAQVGSCEGAQVKAVDAEKRTITFHDKAPAAVAGKTFPVAQDANIVIDGKPGKLSELPAGAFLNLGFSVDRRTIRHFNAHGPNVGDCGGSLVKTVDAERNTITFDDQARAGVAGKTYSVTKDAHIVIDGKVGKLTDIPSGSYVSLALCVDQKTARSVNANGAQVGDCVGSEVKAIDVEQSTITFADNARGGVAGKTYRVAKDAHIVIDGKLGKLADIPAGSFVNLGLCVDQQTARSVNAQGPQVGEPCGSEVKAVEVTQQTITFADNARAGVAGKTYRVAKDAHIVIDGKVGKLTDIPSGSFVNLGLCVDQQTARSVNAQGAQVGDCVGSEVKAVAVDQHTITFADHAKGGVAGKTYRVARDAHIVIDGKLAKLADIPAGSFLNLGLCVDQQTARSINAQGAQVGDCGGSQVSAIDVEKYTITFADNAKGGVAGKTYRVAREAHIVIDGKLAKLTDLPVGAHVNLGLRVDQKTARSVSARTR
jgi:RNA polymerase sigma factor (sigma-70 family)